jgi:2-polyprenyl-3-methyl-5-hydroxy-6-metoxy-1,4-benzoquinol methylase
MNYRERLYGNYVSANKDLQRNALANPRKQDKRNILNLRRALRGWFGEVPRDGKVLDVACGPGNLLEMLQEEGFMDLRGVDISAEQIAIAQKKFPQVVCGDALEYLRGHSETFKLITAFDILEHLSKAEALEFLDAIRSALKPGGQLILQLPNADSPFSGGIIHGDFTHEVAYTTVSLEHLLRTCGFGQIRFQEHSPQPTSAKGFVRSLLWSAMRVTIRLIHVVETGGPSTGIYTRVMRVIAVKE